MEDKGEKRILGRSSFSLLIENLSERFRTASKESTGVWRYFNTTATKGKRNVVLLCYALGFIGLHAVWQQSKKNKTIINENTEGEEESATTSWTSWRNRLKKFTPELQIFVICHSSNNFKMYNLWEKDLDMTADWNVVKMMQAFKISRNFKWSDNSGPEQSMKSIIGGRR